MAVTKVAGKTGVYRHTATKFVVHEVYNVQDVLNCNGVFLEDTVNNLWAWYAGRDLRDLLISTGASTLSDICSKAKGVMYGFRGKTMPAANQGQLRSIASPLALMASTSYPFTANRIYGLVTGLDCGHGTNLDTAMNSGVVQSMLGANGDGRAMQLYPDSVIPTVLGTGAMRFGTGFSYEQHLDQYYSVMPDKEQPDVASKIAAAKARTAKYLQDKGIALNHAASIWIPVVIRSDGRVQYVPPKANRRSNNGYWAGKIQYVRNLGVRAYFPSGRGISMPARGNSSATIMFEAAYHWDDYTSGTFTPPATTPTQVVDGLPYFNMVDDVRVERILGGVMNMGLSDAGEITQTSTLTLDLKGVLAQYLAAPIINAALPTRPIRQATGQPMTDAEWKNTLEAQYSTITSNDMSDIILTNYDTWGITLNFISLLASMAMDETKATRSTLVGFENGYQPIFGFPNGDNWTSGEVISTADRFSPVKPFFTDKVFA